MNLSLNFMVFSVVSGTKGDWQLCFIQLHCHLFYHQRKSAMVFDQREVCVLGWWQLGPCTGEVPGAVWCQWSLSGCSCLWAESGVFVRLQSIRYFMLGFFFNLHHLLLFSCWIESTKGRNSTMFALIQSSSSAAKKPFNVGYCVHKRPSNVIILSSRRGESMTLLFYDFSSSVWEWLQDHCSCLRMTKPWFYAVSPTYVSHCISLPFSNSVINLVLWMETFFAKYLCMAFGWSLYSCISLFPLSAVPTLLVTTDISFRVELCFYLSCFTIGLGLYFVFFFDVPFWKKKVCFLQMILSSSFIHSLHVSLLIPQRIVLLILHQEKDWCFLVHLYILL